MDLLKGKNSLTEGYSLHWYEIIRVIGRGGFGITYLAHDTNLDRNVAIKEFMPEDFATRESNDTVNPKTGEQKKLYDWGLERFIDEARTLAKFNHPNIVRVLSVFEENNTAYMVMEYAQGQDLSVIYKKQPRFTQDQLLDTFIPILDGLSLVHNAGFIHRDIKPANIYICDNNAPLLLDFGSARQSIGGKTKALTSLVTFGYAPYEQYNEGTGKQGPWTDIYSLGASMYYGITGKKPVDALLRGGSFLEQGLDTYEPVSISAKGDYAENFLLAIDNALMFKIDERPENVFQWADLLLDKTRAPALPDYMIRRPEDDETIVRPWPKNVGDTGSGKIINSSQRVNSGRQGLIDAQGKRHSSRTDTVIKDNSQPPAKRPGTSAGAKSRTFPDTEKIADKKSGFPVIPAVFIALILLAGVGWFLSQSESTSEKKSESVEKAEELKLSAENKHKIAQQKHQKKINELLIRAEQASEIGNYVTPDKNNAHYFYKQILKLNAGDKQAKRGLNNIEKELMSRASSAYIEKQYEQSHDYLQQLKIINSQSAKADSLRNRLNSEKNKLQQIQEWLSEAENHLKNNRYTSPVNRNSYELYRKILVRQPDNETASEGIKKIQQYYVSLFKRHMKKTHLKSAEQDIRVMKNIAIPVPDIKRMEKQLKNKLAEKKRNQAKKIVVKKLTIEQVSGLLSRFKMALQAGDKRKVDNMSQYLPGRKQFVVQFLSQYKKVNVKVLKLQLIPVKNNASIKIELTDLVDISGKKVTPGNWSRIDLTIRYNHKNEPVVVW